MLRQRDRVSARCPLALTSARPTAARRRLSACDPPEGRRDRDLGGAGRSPCKPVSVPVRGRVAAIHLGRVLPGASSDPPGTLARRTAALPPIWSCSAWGLPCRRGHPRRGALLPHHFTLTPETEAVSFLWHFPSATPREDAARPLAGTLPCGDRTFLDPRRRRDCPDDRP